MATGTVKFFNLKKGFGFIASNDGGEDMFVHATDVQEADIDALHPNQSIKYDIGTSAKNGRSRAINLRLL